MAKRFTDTEKWRKQFMRNLPPAYKLLWFYVLDACDMAGVWYVDWEIAQLMIGESVDQGTAVELFGDRIFVFEDGKKWFLPAYVEFQYGELKATNRMHTAVLRTLKKHGLDCIDGASKPLIRAQGQYQGQGQGQGKEEGGVGETDLTDKQEVFALLFTDERWVTDMKIAYPNKNYERAFNECYLWHMARPNPPNTLWLWRQKVLSWLSNMKEEKNGTKTHQHITGRPKDPTTKTFGTL